MSLHVKSDIASQPRVLTRDELVRVIDAVLCRTAGHTAEVASAITDALMALGVETQTVPGVNELYGLQIGAINYNRSPCRPNGRRIILVIDPEPECKAEPTPNDEWLVSTWALQVLGDIDGDNPNRVRAAARRILKAKEE